MPSTLTCSPNWDGSTLTDHLSQDTATVLIEALRRGGRLRTSAAKMAKELLSENGWETPQDARASEFLDNLVAIAHDENDPEFENRLHNWTYHRIIPGVPPWLEKEQARDNWTYINGLYFFVLADAAYKGEAKMISEGRIDTATKPRTED